MNDITSLSMIISGSIHVDANGSISFLWLSNIPLHIYTTSSLSIHLLMDAKSCSSKELIDDSKRNHSLRCTSKEGNHIFNQVKKISVSLAFTTKHPHMYLGLSLFRSACFHGEVFKYSGEKGAVNFCFCQKCQVQGTLVGLENNTVNKVQVPLSKCVF